MAAPQNTNIKETFAALSASDAQLTPLANSPYAQAAPGRVAAAKAGLEAKGFNVVVVANKDEAFAAVKSLIPAGASVNNAHSTTLEEIGFITYLKGETPYKNVHADILKETDQAKQGLLRRTVGISVDYYLTSLAAVAETGEIAHADLSGSKVGGVAFGAANVIAVVGSNKIVKDAAEAWKRTSEFALPSESARVRIAYGLPASAITHYELINQANPFNKGRITIVIVSDVALGY